MNESEQGNMSKEGEKITIDGYEFPIGTAVRTDIRHDRPIYELPDGTQEEIVNFASSRGEKIQKKIIYFDNFNNLFQILARLKSFEGLENLENNKEYEEAKKAVDECELKDELENLRSRYQELYDALLEYGRIDNELNRLAGFEDAGVQQGAKLRKDRLRYETYYPQLEEAYKILNTEMKISHKRLRNPGN